MIQDYLYQIALKFIEPLEGSLLREGRGLHVPSSLEGRVALVTGSTKGCGYYAAKRFHGLGAEVIITGRSDASAGRAAKTLGQGGERATGLGLDTSDFDDVRRFVGNVEARFPKLHYLVMNAGTSHAEGATTEKGWDMNEWVTDAGVNRVLAANHFGHFLLGVLLAPRMAPGATIVTVSSLASWWSDVDWMFFMPPRRTVLRTIHKDLRYARLGDGMYDASKLGNLCFGKALNRLGQKHDISAVTMTPGQVGTEINKYVNHGINVELPPDWGGENEFLAAMVTKKPTPDFIYPYWFPRFWYSWGSSMAQSKWRSKRLPEAKGYKYEGPRGYWFRPEKFQNLSSGSGFAPETRVPVGVYGSIGPECDEALQTRIWEHSVKVVGLDDWYKTGDPYVGPDWYVPAPGVASLANMAKPKAKPKGGPAAGKGRGAEL